MFKNHKKKIIVTTLLSVIILLGIISTYYAYKRCIGNMYCINFVSSFIPGGKHNSPQKDEDHISILKLNPNTEKPQKYIVLIIQ